MKLQYITDKSGKPTVVVIPIADWEALTTKYSGIQEEDEEAVTIPDWQIALGLEEIKKLQNGSAELLSWKESKKQLKF